MGGGQSIILTLAIVLIGFFVFLWWRIWSKAGYSGAWSLLILIPFVGIFAFLGSLIFLAFSEWPVSKNQISPSTFD